MNEILRQKIVRLSEAEWQQLQTQLSDAPLLRKLSEKLRASSTVPLKTRTLVEAVYGSQNSERYAVLENRFYKLRKKLHDVLLSTTGSGAARKLAQEEETKELCKRLVEKGELAQAAKMLSALEKSCFLNNIFELLPEIIDLQIQANQSLNRFSETQKLYPKFEEASGLYIALSKMKVLARQVYETNVNSGITAAQPLFKQMDFLARTHAAYPRFKLIYNFVAAYYKAGSGGKNGSVKSYAVSRHIAVAKQIMLQFPDMPIIGYSADFQHVQQFRLKELESLFFFRQFRFKESAAISNELLKDVFDNSKKLRRLANEVMISNAIHINIAAKDLNKALDAVQLYFKFLRDNNYHERLPRAFCEFANVASTLHEKPAHFNSKAVLKNIDEFATYCKKNGHSSVEVSTRFLKAKTLLLLGQNAAALKIFELADVKAHIDYKPLRSLFYEMLQAVVSGVLKNKKDFLQRLKKLKFNLQTPESVMELAWIECALEKHFGI